MGNLRLFRIWLLLGSVFMLFLIILYWDEVGNAGLHLRSSLPAPPLPLLPIANAGLPLASPRPSVVSTSTQLVTWTSEDKGYSFIWDTDAFDRAVMVDPDPPETRPTRHAAAVPSRAQQRPVPIPPEIVENPDVPESPETTVPPKQVLEPTPTQTRWSIPPTAVSTTTTTTNSPTTITPVAHGNPSSHPTQPPRRHNASVNTPGAPAVPVPPTAPFFSLLRRQAERRRQLQEACAENSGFDFPGKLRSFDQIPSQALDHLIVDDRHGIIYCYVPKVACTNWKRVMIVLGEKLVAGGGGAGGAGGGSDDPNAAPTPYRHPQDVPSELSHNGTLHLTFNKFWRRYGKASRSLMHAKLRKYTKFLFVRDPFVRLMSAFRNKLAQPNEDFYRQFSAHMLQRYANVSRPPSTAREAFKAGLRPSFGDFVRYLLDPETEKEEVFNEHWRQVYRLCHPCQIGYDFIGKLETLDEDADHLLHILDVDRQIQFPPGYRNRTAASWEQDWFANVPFEDRKKLYELYEPDFRLFGYPRPEALLHD